MLIIALSSLPMILSLAAPPPVAQPDPWLLPAQPLVLASAPSSARPAADSDFELSYTYVELGYFSTDVDVVNENTDAWGGRASLGLFDFLFFFLDYAQEEVKFAGNKVESDSFALGVGAHMDMSPKLDLVGELAWLYDDLSSSTISTLDDTNDGWMAFAGARWLAMPTDRGGLELNGGFRWIDREAILSDDETGAWEAGARFHFLKLFSVGATYQFLEDDSRWGINARVSF